MGGRLKFDADSKKADLFGMKRDFSQSELLDFLIDAFP